MQCLKAGANSLSVLHIVHRLFPKLDREGFLIMYKTYVRPHMEFCIQAWSPYLRRDIDHLERVQRQATKIVVGLRNLSYEARLNALGLTTLEARRMRGDLIEVYKLMSGKELVDWRIFFRPALTNHLRGHSKKIFVQHSRLLIRKQFFSQRVVSAWNSLPQSVVDATSTNMFKNRVDQYLGHGRY